MKYLHKGNYEDSNWLILQVWTNSVSNTLIVSLIKIFRFFLIINIFKRKNELVKSLNYFERKANLMFRKWITSAERARGQVGELGVHGVCVIASLHLPAHFVHFQNRMNVALREDIAWKMILLKIKKKNREPSSSESLSSSSKSLIHSRFGKFRFFRLNSLERWKLENSWKWFFFKKSNFFLEMAIIYQNIHQWKNSEKKLFLRKILTVSFLKSSLSYGKIVRIEKMDSFPLLPGSRGIGVAGILQQSNEIKNEI